MILEVLWLNLSWFDSKTHRKVFFVLVMAGEGIFLAGELHLELGLLLAIDTLNSALDDPTEV